MSEVNVYLGGEKERVRGPQIINRQSTTEGTTYSTALLHLCCVSSLKELVRSLRSHSVRCALHYQTSHNCSSHCKIEFGYCWGPQELWNGNKNTGVTPIIAAPSASSGSA